MTSIWMVIATVQGEMAAGRFEATGDKEIVRSMQAWLGLSPFAQPKGN